MLVASLLPLFALTAIASPLIARTDCPEGNGLTVPALYDRKCYYPVPDKEFKLENYLGKWYQQAATATPFNAGCRCVSAEYKLNDNGTVNVFNKCERVAGSQDIEGTAAPADKAYGNDGVFIVKFAVSPPSTCPGPNYIVQEYNEKWAIVQSQNWSTLFILSRDQEVPAADVDAWLKKAESLGSDLAKVEKTEQTDCPAS